MSILRIREGVPNTTDSLEAAEGMLHKAKKDIHHTDLTEALLQAHTEVLSAQDIVGHDRGDHIVAAAESLQGHLGASRVAVRDHEVLDLLTDALFHLGMAYAEVEA